MKILAHRGASGYYPENTMLAFSKAIEMGADGIELDVHLTKDNKVVVCHDETIDRTSNGKGKIADYTYQELKQFDFGSGQTIPLLRDVFELIAENDLIINIEIKAGTVFYLDFEEHILNLIDEYKMEERVIISSFNHYCLLKIKQLNKKIKIGLLYASGLVDPWKYAKSINADAIHPIYYNALIPNLVRDNIKAGIDVNFYTVNSKNDIQMVLLTEPTSIITNYPDKAIAIRDGIDISKSK